MPRTDQEKRTFAQSLQPWIDEAGIDDKQRDARAAAAEKIKEAYNNESTNLDLFPGLTSLPDSLSKLADSLISLDIGGNNFSDSFPQVIGTLNNLTYLFIASCQLTQFPREVLELSKLETLLMTDNNIILPQDISRLGKLIKLDLQDTGLKLIPKELFDIETLQDLDLSRNFLEEIPHQIGQLTSLTTLDICENKLTQIPESLFTADRGNAVLEIDAAQNKFSPEELARFEVLKTQLQSISLYTEVIMDEFHQEEPPRDDHDLERTDPQVVLQTIMEQSAQNLSQEDQENLIASVANLKNFQDFLSLCSNTGAWKKGGEKQKEFCDVLYEVLSLIKDDKGLANRVDIQTINPDESCGDLIASIFAKIQLTIKFPQLLPQMYETRNFKEILNFAKHHAFISFIRGKTHKILEKLEAEGGGELKIEPVEIELDFMQISNDLGIDFRAIDMRYASNVAKKDKNEAIAEYQGTRIINTGSEQNPVNVEITEGEYLTYKYMLNDSEFAELPFVKEVLENQIKEEEKSAEDITAPRDGESEQDYTTRMQELMQQREESLVLKLRDRFESMLREEPSRKRVREKEEGQKPDPKRLATSEDMEDTPPSPSTDLTSAEGTHLGEDKSQEQGR